MNKFLSSTRWSIRYIALVPIIVFIVVTWNAYQRINEFELAHQRIAKSTVTIVASEISKRIQNQQRLLSIFAKNEVSLIHRAALELNNETLKILLDKKVAESFPNYFAVSIVDRDGIPIIDDFDDLIGALCLQDLKHHAEGNPPPVRIHPNIHAYHIDIIVPWDHTTADKNNETNAGFLLVSFKPDFLFKLLELSSTPRHELMLINKNIKNLIEITEKGSRIHLKRDDFRLTKEEQQRRLYSAPVEYTVWDLTDFREETLYSEYYKNIIIFSFVIVSFFLIGSMLMVMLLLRIEKIRISAEEAKEEMFSLFNHDLRSPLNSIYGFLEIYIETGICEKEPQKCKKLASNAFKNALMMRDIVDDILNVQKMEAGVMSFYFAETDIISLVEDTIKMNMQHALMLNVKLNMLSDESIVYLNVDKRRIKQALTNLLSNAIKYSPENETVTVMVEKQSSEIIISVTDNGPGIEKDFQNLIFDKFSQSKSKLTRHVGGTGLGLTIVKHIIDAHKGEVSFVTEIDKGTTFKITLPFNLVSS